MKKIINKVISKIKGEPYKVDENIPNSYLLGLSFSKFGQLLRGRRIRFGFKRKHKGKRVFIGKRVKIKCKKKISCGRGLTIEDNTYINALSKNGIVFGNNVSIGRNSIIECTGVLKNLGDGLIIEDNVGIAPNAFLGVRGSTKIGKNTIIGPYFKLHSENHNFSDLNTPIRLQGETRKGIEIGQDCWIGSNVTVLDGVEIGDGCIIGAGAVVTKSIEPYSIVAGVPAKVIGVRQNNERSAENE